MLNNLIKLWTIISDLKGCFVKDKKNIEQKKKLRSTFVQFQNFIECRQGVLCAITIVSNGKFWRNLKFERNIHTNP